MAVAAGTFATAQADYRLPDLAIPSLPVPVEVEGHVIGPVDAPGALPLVVILHGFIGSCWNPSTGDSSGDWPCKEGFEPIPNAAGFGYLQERLASQGYLTVSLSANGVNVQATDMGGDAGAQERAALVSHHLDAWAAGSVPGMTQWPDVDSESVMLIGHSRGGEGMDRTSTDRPETAGWSIAGEVLLAPTAFEPAAESVVPVLTVTGYCDGDVGPAGAQRYVDRPGGVDQLRSAVIVGGANHNFFNTEWVPGTNTVPGAFDDAFHENGEADPMCVPDAPTRLSAAEQQDAAARLVGLAAAAFLRDDASSADVLDGRTPVPGTGDTDIRISALGRGRTTLVNDSDFTGSGSGPMDVSECVGTSETEDPNDCGAFTGEGVSVHWPDAWRNLPADTYLSLQWSQPGGSVRLELKEPLDLTDAAGVEARLAVVPAGPPVQTDIVITDADGPKRDPAGGRRRSPPTLTVPISRPGGGANGCTHPSTPRQHSTLHRSHRSPSPPPAHPGALGSSTSAHRPHRGDTGRWDRPQGERGGR